MQVRQLRQDRTIVRDGSIRYQSRPEHAMPIYEYACRACGNEWEHFTRKIDAPAPPCEECDTQGQVERLIARSAFIKDENTKMREMHPKYAKMVDAAWDKASRNDPLSKTRFAPLVDSGKRVQDMT